MKYDVRMKRLQIQFSVRRLLLCVTCLCLASLLGVKAYKIMVAPLDFHQFLHVLTVATFLTVAASALAGFGIGLLFNRNGWVAGTVLGAIVGPLLGYLVLLVL